MSDNNKGFKLTYKYIKRWCSFKYNRQHIPKFKSRNLNAWSSIANIMSYDMKIRMLSRVTIMNVTTSNKEITKIKKSHIIYSLKHEESYVINIDICNV